MMMSVAVPAGTAPGGTFQMATPDGQLMTVTCPPGVAPGQQIQVQVASGTPSASAPPPVAPLAPVPAQMDFGARYSASNMSGTWTTDSMDCSTAPLYVWSQGEDAFQTQSPGWMALGCACVGAQPLCNFTRSPGTNNFQTAGAEQTAILLLSERDMQIGSVVWSWGPSSSA